MIRVFNTNEEKLEGVLTVDSTSRNSAKTESFSLRDDSGTSSLRFNPIIVNNPSRPSDNVEGSIVYQRKGKHDEHFPLDDESKPVSKKDIRKGDALILHLDSSETKALYQGLHRMYGLAESLESIPIGSTTYVEMDNAARTLLSMLKKNPSAARMIADDQDTFELIEELLKLLTQGTSREDLHAILAKMGDENLSELSAGANLQQLRNAASLLEQNLQTSSEEFWQRFFTEHPWIISQLFSTPCTLFGAKTYVGGKSINNQGGNVVDFIYQNDLTKNVSLVEIKTPSTAILGQAYRQQIRSLSSEMSGAVNQVLNYRQSLISEYAQLAAHSLDRFTSFSPKCIVIIGNTEQFIFDGIRDEGAFATFENFRNCLNGITVVTYDELLGRIRNLIGVLQADEVQSS